jgi:hypothetical protein
MNISRIANGKIVERWYTTSLVRSLHQPGRIKRGSRQAVSSSSLLTQRSKYLIRRKKKIYFDKFKFSF